MQSEIKKLIAVESLTGQVTSCPSNWTKIEGQSIAQAIGQPNYTSQLIEDLANFSKLAVDVLQSTNPVATIKSSAAGVRLKLTPLGQRLMVAIDNGAFAVLLPERFCFEPYASVVINAIRLHLVGRTANPAQLANPFTHISMLDTVKVMQVLNAITFTIRTELKGAPAVSRRIFHDIHATQRARDLRSALLPAISKVKGTLHVVQADLSIPSDFYGAAAAVEMDDAKLKLAGKNFLQQVRIQFGAAALVTFVDHSYLPGGHALHFAAFFDGPSIDEMEAIRVELESLWSRCTATRGVLTHTCVPGSPFHFRGLDPEAGAIMTPKMNLARVADFIGFREYYLADKNFSSRSDRFVIEFAPKTKRKTMPPKVEGFFETADISPEP